MIDLLVTIMWLLCLPTFFFSIFVESRMLVLMWSLFCTAFSLGNCFIVCTLSRKIAGICFYGWTRYCWCIPSCYCAMLDTHACRLIMEELVVRFQNNSKGYLKLKKIILQTMVIHSIMKQWRRK